MAKRRLSQQQKKRIKAAQQALASDADYAQGLVVSHQGGQLLVELDETAAVECKIKSNLGLIVCGDRVSVELTPQQQYRVVAIADRDNLLQRVDGFGQVRAVAANISQLFVCLSVSPEPNIFLLDQYLLSAEQQRIDACIVLNKIDLLGEASAELHAGAGRSARAAGIDRLFALGELAQAAARAFGSRAMAFSSQDALIKALHAELHGPLHILVKGSRRMRMERVVEALLSGGGA